MKTRSGISWLLALLAVWLSSMSVQSADVPDINKSVLRDPTLPPPVYSLATGDSINTAPKRNLKPQQIVIVDGKRFLVWNSRHYLVGESINGARIERISETEVWLHDADGLRKLALFSGVDKRQAASGSVEKKLALTRESEKKGNIK